MARLKRKRLKSEPKVADKVPMKTDTLKTIRKISREKHRGMPTGHFHSPRKKVYTRKRKHRKEY